MGNRRGGELNPDQVVLIVVALAAAFVLVARGQQVLAVVGDWLRGHHLLAAQQGGGLTIPHLGTLDGPRLMVVAGALIIVVVVARAIRRGVLRRHGESYR